MTNNVLVIAEQRDGVLKKVAFEALGVGAELAVALEGQVEAILLGSGLGELPTTLGQFGATKVYVADDPALTTYSGEAYVNTLAAVIGKIGPAVILMGATALGRDLAPLKPLSWVMSILQLESFILSLRESAEKPPKTMEWMAPILAHASMDMASSGTICR